MANLWFRMYSEFADDPKVQMMPEHMQRRLIMLFCERCKGETLHETERAFHWRVTETELAETKAIFMQKEFIDADWNLTNWNKRQFISDSSTDRVRRFRSTRKQDETFHETAETKVKRPQPVTVTAPDTDTDTDTEHKKHARSVPPEELAGTLPLVDGTDYQVSKAQIKEWSEAFPAVDVKQQLLEFKSWLNSDPKRRKTHRGICKSIFYWLSTEQDKSGRMPYGGNGHKPPPKVQILSRPGVAHA